MECIFKIILSLPLFSQYKIAVIIQQKRNKEHFMFPYTSLYQLKHWEPTFMGQHKWKTPCAHIEAGWLPMYKTMICQLEVQWHKSIHLTSWLSDSNMSHLPLAAREKKKKENKTTRKQENRKKRKKKKDRRKKEKGRGQRGICML